MESFVDIYFRNVCRKLSSNPVKKSTVKYFILFPFEFFRRKLQNIFIYHTINQYLLLDREFFVQKRDIEECMNIFLIQKNGRINFEFLNV